MEIEEVIGKRIRLLIDTGADVSVIKIKNLENEVPVYEKTIAMRGITQQEITAIGLIIGHIKVDYKYITHDFYAVQDDFPIQQDGILGLDFLQKYGADIDLKNNRLTALGYTWRITSSTFRTTLKPRTETIVQVVTTDNTEGIISGFEVEPGVYLGNCMVRPENNICPVSIINSTERTVSLDTLTMQVEAVDQLLVPRSADVLAYDASTIGPERQISRSSHLRETLRTDHLNQAERKSLFEICDEYKDIFYLPGDFLSSTNTVQHYIPIFRDSAPINVKPYRLPEKHKQEVNRQIQEMLDSNIIRPSTSQWNAPLIVVPKKLGVSGKPKLRIVIDFRKLNNITIGDSFPLPNIVEILDQLGNAMYFTTLDLASGFHQIQMCEQDKCKTAFSSPYGHFEYNRMPFGLKNAPATFQRLMNSVLTGLQGIKCFVYLDDIVIHAASLVEHNKRLIEVFDRLRENNLKMQPEKCEFLRKEVNYLGHVITNEGIKPDPAKITAVKEFPTPKCEKDIQSFLGLAGYYRRFIKDFSKIARPLSQLLRKDNLFEWTQTQNNAFNELKESLTTPPVLIYPDFTKSFLLTTDASNYAIGAIISQGPIGRDLPIAYASRTLNSAERNYSTTEKELLAIVWAVNHFRPYLYGTHFKIVTDHKPLTWLFSVKDPGSRLIRWRLKLEEYDYEIEYKAGKTNTNVDALSRIHVATRNQTKSFTEPEKTVTAKTVRNNDLLDEQDNCESRFYTEEEKRQILHEYHDAPIGGHQGVNRTTARIKLKHHWPNMRRDIESYISKCDKCQRNKLSKRTKVPMIITDTPIEPFEKCALDIVGPLNQTENGNKYILTFQDCLTKFSKAIPLPNQEAVTVAKEFVTKIVCDHGIPKKILTDQGTNFLSEVFKGICKLLKISKLQTTAYHPESNGALERSHRTLAEYLRHYVNDEQNNWDEWLPYAMFTYNTTPHSATRFTPFELMYGRQAEIPTSLKTEPKLSYAYDDYVQELRERLRATNTMAKENLGLAKERSKETYDKRTRPVEFQIGDKVLLYDETIRRGRSKKLMSQWIGPYRIIEKNSGVNYTIKVRKKTIKVHANRLKLFIE